MSEDKELLTKVLINLNKTLTKFEKRLEGIEMIQQEMTTILDAHQKLILAIHLAISEGEEQIPAFMPTGLGS